METLDDGSERIRGYKVMYTCYRIFKDKVMQIVLQFMDQMEGIIRNASACAIVIRKLMRKDEGQWSCQLEVRGYEKPVTKEIIIRQELLSQKYRYLYLYHCILD